MKASRGFTMIEVIIVIAIIGILASLVLFVISNSRDKAADVRIKNNIRQMRWLAEVVYDAQKGSFNNWPAHADVIADFNKLKADIDDAHGAAITINVGQADIQSFCVSAPLISNSSKYYCIDAARALKETNAICPAVAPHICP